MAHRKLMQTNNKNSEIPLLTHSLSNGIRLIHKHNDAPVSHVGLLINAGTRDEKPHEQGMAHFIEHVIFKGTHKRKAFHILNHLDNVGGDLNAYTAKEETCIYASFLNRYYERTLELLADICFNSIFPEKEIEKEKEVIFDEINQYKDAPSELIFDEFENMVFEGHPMGRFILGTKQTVKTFGKSAIEAFIHNNYNTDQIVISSVGSIHFDKLVKITEKLFGAQKSNIRQNPREPILDYKPKTIITRRKNHQSHVVIGTTAYSFNHDKHTALAMLNNILGGPGLNCRLNMNIREKLGYCYSIDSNYTPYSDTGVFNVYFATDRTTVEKVSALVYRELDRLKNEKLGTLQLLRAKNQLKGQMAIAAESKLSEMLSIGKSLLVYNKVDTLDLLYEKIDSITSEELMDVACDIFNTAHFSTLTYQNN